MFVICNDYLYIGINLAITISSLSSFYPHSTGKSPTQQRLQLKRRETARGR
ncbi:hypothetical protein SynBIOSE41_03002 [Synechococcus sp. BIOS-E4-1]|nr:hypothetical protein SynBIOSE41_03002 [Synechococcus sp. BIOS-E4-1]